MAPTGFLFVLLIATLNPKAIVGRSFVLEDSYKCNKIKYPVELTVDIIKTFKNSSNILNAHAVLPINFGENIAVNLLIEYMASNKDWVNLFTINEKRGFCTFINNYMGQFFYDVERAAGLAPKECPLPKRTYAIKNFLINFEKLKLQTFPAGKLRLTMNFKEKSDDKLMLCQVFLLSNQ